MAYNAEPLKDLRVKYQEKIDKLISEFQKEIQTEIENQHNLEENRQNLISFELFKYGVYGIWSYASKEDFNLGEPVLKKSEDAFQDTLEKIQSFDCFKTKVVLESIKPKFVPNKLERFQELQEKYEIVKDLSYDKENNSICFTINTVIFTIDKRIVDYKGDASEIAPEVIVPIIQEITTILNN